MSIELPSFDELARLAADDPEELEALRQALVAQHIASRPESKHQKLERLQFRIDGVIQRSNNPVHACVLLHQLMIDNTSSLLHEMKQLPRTVVSSSNTNSVVKQPRLILISGKE